jgi:methionine biosynthesis protein MetW
MTTASGVRLDYRIIEQIIPDGAKVLDLGCGNGELLLHLTATKKVKGQGIELNENSIYRCVEKGLSVFHSDIDSGLSGYPDKTFDYVILNRTLQEVRKIPYVVDESLRVGHHIIVGFPNFAHMAPRLMLLFKGRVPVTGSLPHQWYDTPNLRFLSINDFEEFCAKEGIKILERYYLGETKQVRLLPNLFASSAVFVITK